MQKDLTDIVVILDRSGSMEECRQDAEGGLNSFVAKQKEQPGRARYTLVQFDDQYEMVHNGIDIKDVPRFTLVPRGWTALLDAVGKTINDVGERLDKTPENDRPGLVVVVIITDGLENRSTEYKGAEGYARIKEKIQHQIENYGWQFTYLGANQDAFKVAEAMGIGVVSAANYTGKNTARAFGAAHNNVARMRVASAGGQHVNCTYTAEERKAMAEDSQDNK